MWGIRSWILLILHAPIHQRKPNLYRFADLLVTWQERNTYQLLNDLPWQKLKKHQPTTKKMHLHHPIPFPSPQNHQQYTYHHQTKHKNDLKNKHPQTNQPVLDHDHDHNDHDKGCQAALISVTLHLYPTTGGL